MPKIIVASQSTAFRTGVQAMLARDPAFTFFPEIYPAVKARREERAEGIWIISANDASWVFEDYPDLLLGGQGFLVIGGDGEFLVRLGIPKVAWGLLPVQASSEVLQTALYAIDEGLTVLPPGMLAKMRGMAFSIRAGSDLVEPLSDRELEILVFLSKGQQNKQIAHSLHLSENTIKFHIAAIYSKLNVTNRTEAAAKGAQLGLLAL